MKIKKIIVAGGGTAGFITAITLQKRFDLDITMIVPKDIGIIGVGEGSTEHFQDFLEYCGWDKTEMVLKTKSTIKGGIMFKGWNPKWDFYHSLSGNIAFEFGLMQPFMYECMIEGLSPETLSQRTQWHNKVQNVFELAPPHRPNAFDGAFQLHFNTFELNKFFQEKFVEAGGKIIDDKVIDVRTDINGISQLVGEKGKYEADFYIDSTGFRKVLISKLGAKWQSWKKWLAMKEAIAFPTPDEDEYPMWTESLAMDAGWKWKIPTWGRFGNGYIYDSDYINKDQAVQEVEKKLGHKIDVAKHIKFDPGALDKCWIKNCIAVGLSANFIEPLEATSIASSIQQAFILIHRFQNYDQTTIDDYNKKVNNLLENMKDFVSMRYINKGTGSKFWKEVGQKTEITDNIKHFQKIWKTRLIDGLDMDSIYNRYVLFGPANFNQMGYCQDLIKGEDIKDYYINYLKPTLQAHIHFQNGDIFGYIDKQSGRLGQLPHKEYLRQLHKVKDHNKVIFPQTLDYIPTDWERPSFIDQFIAIDVIKNIDENHSAITEAKTYADKKGLKCDNDKNHFKDA